MWSRIVLVGVTVVFTIAIHSGTTMPYSDIWKYNNAQYAGSE